MGSRLACACFHLQVALLRDYDRQLKKRNKIKAMRRSLACEKSLLLLARGKQAPGVGSPPARACAHIPGCVPMVSKGIPMVSRGPRNVGCSLLARCAVRRVAQLAELQRQFVQALSALPQPVCKDSGRAVAWRHEYERQVNPWRFACMFFFDKIPRSLQPARERSGRARASSAETWEVTCLRGVATYTSHVAVEVCEQQVRYG